MVSQLRPACAPSRIRNSNSSRSSWTGTPHSVSWYGIYSSVLAQGHRNISASHPLRSVAHAFQPGSQSVTLIALNLNHAVLDRPTCTAPNLQLRGQFVQASLIERDIGYGCHALTPPALRLPTKADHGGQSPWA